MKRIMTMAVLAGLLSACGSDGNDTADTAQAYSGTVVGQVERVQADRQTIHIQGRELDTTRAQVSYQDQPLQLTDVMAGMLVEIDSEKGRVSEIELEPMLSGEVATVDGTSLSVNGQTFPLNEVTTTAQVGDFVLIFGQPQADGSLRLTAIQSVDTTAISEVEGRISQLDTAAKTLVINGTTVDFSGAVLDDEPLQHGIWVEVTGAFINGVFQASEVDVEDETDFDGKSLEGVITFVNQEKTTLELNSRTLITLTRNTRYEDGTQADLTTGRIVDVDVFSQNAQLFAEEVEFESAAEAVQGKQFSIEGQAQYVDETLSINGIVLTLSPNVRLEDGLTLTALDGQWFELEGSEVEGLFLVREIEPEIQESEVSLEGLVTDNHIWGYRAADASLSVYEGQWVDVECRLDGLHLSQCHLDD
ncbi:hypothetical protein KDD30_09135 [Photobacterium sp. GJ3]|uniref:DUF5666 domain-containing protein n=1 Tax=Photobacterium sp. GJ3 TaxID=2829502 RepID=UPI001B8AE1BA|nr:DUF5666 domain-containing protein [Photobacterium sp. GJ3]QUJ66347.1 hypothetical protein KDD30_09135 [Photobacterium sp. GJ3]